MRKRGRGKSAANRARSKTRWRHEVSAGGVIWRHGPEGHVQVALVRPKGRSTWVLPKGHVEQGETLTEAAAREAREESGLEVTVGEPLGPIKYFFSRRDLPHQPPLGISKQVHFFLMQCAGGDTAHHDEEMDESAWFEIDEALARASHRSERELIEKARALLNG